MKKQDLNLEPKRQLLLTSLTNFFEQKPYYKETIYNIIQGVSPISLRVLDWFVTHYAKVHQVMYWYDPNDKNQSIYLSAGPGTNNLKKFHVYFDYRAQLKSFSKTHFDPFRRHERISFVIDDKPQRVVLETTVGQLNFFKWAIENRIVQYVSQNLTEIETCMAQFYQKQDGKKKLNLHNQSMANVKHVSTSCLLRFE